VTALNNRVARRSVDAGEIIVEPDEDIEFGKNVV
jgi:hypothetical protein